MCLQSSNQKVHTFPPTFPLPTNRTGDSVPLHCQFSCGLAPSYMDLNDLNKVWEVKPLKKVREDEAREILDNVAKQVQPIMRKRKWKVKLLSEFCPPNPSLLGLNIGGGAEVKLRLRRPNNEWDFYPYAQILDTMLHELCHNEYGPHNADFYNLLDQIRKECEELMAKGITGTGQGFDLPGKRLGGFSRQPPLSSLRQKALAAAENRARVKVLLPSGPKRLGGDSSIKTALSPIQAAAMAAERRLHDDLWCGSKMLESERPSESSRTSAIPESLHISVVGTDSKVMWECCVCTLLNQPLALLCGACGTPEDRGNEAKTAKVWSCKFCTLHNSHEVERCLACGEWRYSYGPPRVNRIGSGTGGTVYKVLHRPTGRLYALKVIYGNHEDSVRLQMCREIEILRDVDNPNVVRCHDMFDHNGEIQVLLEFMDKGSLEGIHIPYEPGLSDLTRQVLSGLYYLHRRKIVHRDIKPSNLLINSRREVKIADFGVSRVLAQTMDPCNSSVGTIAYMSPERINTDLNHGQYDGYAGDIWSLGVSILEFYLGRFPFSVGRQGDWASLMCAICMSQPPEAPPTASREFREFIACCLQRDPARRWTAAQLLRHPFITQNSPGTTTGSMPLPSTASLSNQVHQAHQLLPPPPHFSSS
ncbi:hypothetical protein HAX54_025577 [Datura stramonium]|uniref:Uncharacterized protein n=1 Tax=Datura stramonium TaxID=4076 RepID=A0ABS8S6C6_DATST|nr:hypothetical protein [Datura stramonium]